ncbi:MAG TPA: hypothetical protein VGU72_17940 [Beijerinckiaceae bacterium]|jgi:hypothetical protein|nr:hypothetical protein [Beijerinckiaceae bacterium]
MTIVRAPTFGRRGVKAAPKARSRLPVAPPPDDNPHPSPSVAKPVDERFTAMARQLLRDGEGELSMVATSDGAVPWSMRAALLAGLVASCLQAGLYVLAAKAPLELIPGLKMTIGDGSQMLLLALVLGLWNGVQIAVTATMASHWAMRFVELTSPTAYAIAGAVSGGIYAYGMTILTGQPRHLIATMASGLTAAFLYRRFAGQGS